MWIITTTIITTIIITTIITTIIVIIIIIIDLLSKVVSLGQSADLVVLVCRLLGHLRTEQGDKKRTR